MGNLKEEICHEQLEWVRRRLEALEQIDTKLRQMRELAAYAVSRSLTNEQAAQVQEWVDILQAEVNALDQQTKKMQHNSLVH